MRQATSLNMVRVVGQVNLNFVVDSAFPLLLLLFPKNGQQSVLDLCVCPFRFLCVFRDLPCFTGKNCIRDFADSAVVRTDRSEIPSFAASATEI